MVEYASYGEEQAQRAIETASATTSQDNAKSGNFAFVIAGVAIVVSLLFGLGVSGCTTLASELIMEDYSYGTSQYSLEDYEQYYDNYLEDTYDFDGRGDHIRNWGELDGFGGIGRESERTTQS